MITWAIIGIVVVAIICIIVGICSSKPSSSTHFHSDDIDEEIYKNNSLVYKDKDYNEQQKSGQHAEANVANLLNRIVKKYKAYVFNDFTIKDENNNSINIDHILVCNGGVFIIETKGNKGTVYGNDNELYWRVVKENNINNKTLDNPIKQNQGHINFLRHMFKNNPPKMYSLIIFPFASIENINSKFVYNIQTAYDFIVGKINECKYSDQFIDRMNKELNNILNKYRITIDEHIILINNKKK